MIAIRFDEQEQVRSFAQYGLQDGRVVDLNSRQSTVTGEDTSILKQLLRGAGGAKAGPMLGDNM